MKETHTRATKLVFRLKKEKLRQEGIDIDLISHEKKEAALSQTELQLHSAVGDNRRPSRLRRARQ